MSHKKTFRDDLFDVLSSVSRYANNIRKQRQRTADYIVALESALDNANMTIDDAMSAVIFAYILIRRIPVNCR